MERKYIALALIGLIGCAALVSAGVIGVEFADGYGVLGFGSGTNDTDNGAGDSGSPGPGRWLRDRIRDRMQDRVWNRIMRQHRHQMQYANRMAGNYLNITRLEGALAYDNDTGTYYIDGTVLYLGPDTFLDRLARSDYDGDGSYEYVWEELQGLLGSNIVVNGLIDGDTLYVSHINGIWLRMPREVTVTELEGVLEYGNGSYVVDGTRLLLPGRRMSRSDIDGDGMLERLHGEMDGLAGTSVVVDGTIVEKGLLVAHVNGISVR